MRDQDSSANQWSTGTRAPIPSAGPPRPSPKPTSLGVSSPNPTVLYPQMKEKEDPHKDAHSQLVQKPVEQAPSSVKPAEVQPEEVSCVSYPIHTIIYLLPVLICVYISIGKYG